MVDADVLVDQVAEQRRVGLLAAADVKQPAAGVLARRDRERVVELAVRQRVRGRLRRVMQAGEVDPRRDRRALTGAELVRDPGIHRAPASTSFARR